MSSRVFINTECSQCGGSINLEEGTNAVSCPYCSSSFLITGYDKVLSYYIPRNAEERRTAVQAIAHRYLLTLTDHYRIAEIHLFYLPFYHLRGKIFQLVPEHQDNALVLHSTDANRTQVKTKYLDKSFLATNLEGLKLYSLGVRTSVLQLKLFKKGTLQEKGNVYPVTIGIERALEIGLGKNHKTATDYCVLSRMLSIVYAPVWEVNVKGINRTFSVIIDALGETIIEDQAPFHFLTDHLTEGTSNTFPTISFHALTCPNCGWDIPPDPGLYVFVCKNCHWVSECSVDGFRETRGAMVRAHGEDELPQLTYFPFWIFPAHKENLRRKERKPAATKVFIPAFKVRDLSVIYRLATAFTTVQPELDLMPLSNDLPPAQIEGAVMKWEDARELADLLVCNGTKKIHLLPQGKPSRQLVWLPFYEKGIYIRDALLHAGIQKAKIRPPKIPHLSPLTR
jgi:DNA-directed RNA polymerase subunit RPC12/RpoP